jgi:leucyl/phenylalanyl-tRNA---protein transferase
MPVFLKTENDNFPAVETADEEGLLAISLDFSVSRLLQAYKLGIFPWFEDEEGFVFWFCVQPRCVLFPNNLVISKSMRQIISKNIFTFKYNTDFEKIILHCSNMQRGLENSTWISPRFIKTYTEMFEQGYAFCGETYLEGNLVGGLYGVRIGNVFYGESMFSLVSNASKFALIKSVEILVQQGVVFIDCQQETEHLVSMGASCVALSQFKKLLSENF